MTRPSARTADARAPRAGRSSTRPVFAVALGAGLPGLTAAGAVGPRLFGRAVPVGAGTA